MRFNRYLIRTEEGRELTRIEVYSNKYNEVSKYLALRKYGTEIVLNLYPKKAEKEDQYSIIVSELLVDKSKRSGLATFRSSFDLPLLFYDKPVNHQLAAILKSHNDAKDLHFYRIGINLAFEEKIKDFT